MKVDFKYGWFGPDAIFYEKGVREVPEEYYDKLPSTAKVVSVEVKAAPVPEKSLKDFDDARANSDATADLLNKFQKEASK